MDRLLKFSSLLLCIIFAIGYFALIESLMQFSLLALYVVIIISCLRDFNKNIVMLLFLIAYFTFLMGRAIMPLFIDLDEYSDLFYTTLSYNPQTIRHVLLSLFLALFFIFHTYTRTNKKMGSLILTPHFDPNSRRIKAIRMYSKIAVFITMPFAFWHVFDKVRFVLTNGYQGFFMNYEDSLPTVALILASVFEYFVFLFLATLPEKKKAFIIIILYLIISVMNIFAGDRGECMLAIFVVIYYFFLRNRLYPGKSLWIGKKGIIGMVIAAPIVMIMLFMINYIRNDTEMADRTVPMLLGGFIYQQSTSMNVIACAYEDYDKLPHGKFYSIGAIIDYIRNNYVSRIVFGIEPYAVGTTELAKNGHSLDSAITLLEFPDFYYNGGGMGSSFVAEAWYDFGYLGIILYSLLYGFVLASIPRWNSKNVWLSVIALMFLKYIIYAPRARATAFIVSAASVAFWPIALIILLLTLQLPSKKK